MKDGGSDIRPASQRLLRVDGDKGLSLAEKLAAAVNRLVYRTPFHRLRLKGRFPLKLVTVPQDPLPGDAEVGQALIQGRMTHAGHVVATREIAAALASGPVEWRVWAHGFSWLRDLGAAVDRARGAKIAEPLVRIWLERYMEFDELAWRPDILGTRILFWTSYAPVILSTNDLVYRSAVLNGLARGARHLERSVDKMPEGLPQLRAIAGLLAAGLLLPGGANRQARAEHHLGRALGAFVLPDGGVASRTPLDQLELLELLLHLQSVYDARKLKPAEALTAAIAHLTPSLKAAVLGDGGLTQMNGGSMANSARIERIIAKSGVMARPVRNGVHSGLQRLSGGKTLVVFDAGPPPVARVSSFAHAGTLAFEMSDGPERVIVNCGGTRGLPRPLPGELAGLLRTTAAHATLVLADTNSTRIRDDGALGRGIEEVMTTRQESEEGTWVDATHDGYRRLGFLHRRRLYLASDGANLVGEDSLVPTRAHRSWLGRSHAVRFDIRFHLAAGTEATPTADGQGALLRLPSGRVWQFKASGGELTLDDSLWIDGEGHPRATQQLVIGGTTPAGGITVNWALRRAR